MSTESLNETIPERRERRITIKLDNKQPPQPPNRQANQSAKQVPTTDSPKSLGKKHTFEAGDEISGVVHLQIFGGQPVAKVTLALVCLTQVRWLAQTNGTRRKSLIDSLFKNNNDSLSDVKENQIYFDRQIFVEIDLAKNLDSKLVNGKYEISFKFYLPTDGLPSTMNGCYGFVKYTIEVFTIDEDRNKSRGETEIIVIAPIEPKLDLNVGEHLEKSLNVPGCGKIRLHSSLERKAYVAGDIVPVKVSVENNLNVPVQPRIFLYQTQEFQCNDVNRTLETCLSPEPFAGEVVDSLSSSTEMIEVPLSNNLVVSLKSSLIVVKYFVHVTLDIPNLLDLHVNLPFLVTTRRAFNQQSRHQVPNIRNNSFNRVNKPQQPQPPTSLPLSPSHVNVDNSSIKLLRVNSGHHSNSNSGNNNNSHNGKRSNV